MPAFTAFLESAGRAPWGLRLVSFMVVSVALGAAVEAATPAAAIEASFVVHGASPERAAAIVAHAEAVRAAIQSRLLTAAAVPPWRPQCEVHVHQGAASFRAAVGISPQVARGATSLEFSGDRVSLRRIDVMGDGPDAVPESLGHELVHVVLGDRFTEAPPPRWADEGLAMLFDSDLIRRRHEADFQAALGNGQTWRLRDLFAVELDPADLGRQRAFYGQSGSLVRWLLDRGDSATLLAFLDDATFDGYTSALRTHYGFESPEQLEAAWRADLPGVP